jgi:hypothetical protein
MVRDMMCYRASRFPDPQTQIREARGLLEFLIQCTSSDAAYGILLRSEAQSLRDKEDGYLIHDELEAINAPIYFAQFAGRAAVNGLQYLAEANLSAMWSRHLPPGVADALERMTSDLIQREQFIDFVRNRNFRQTLPCRREASVDRELRPDCLGRFHVSASMSPVDCWTDGPESGSVKFWHLPSNQEFEADSPLYKGALLCLAEPWPRSVPFSDLVIAA